MFRTQCLRLINLNSNRWQSMTALKRHLPKSSSVFNYSSDVKIGNNSKISLNINNNIDSNQWKSRNSVNSLAEVRERRLQHMKRNIPEGDYDILTEAIIKSTTIEEMLELISLHHSVMNNRHLSEAFESFHDIIRMSNNYTEECIQMLSSPQYKQLCNRAMKRMRYFQSQEILTILKSLLFIKVSPKTMIIQSLLQMARQLINDFSLEQIIFLDFLLNRKMSENINYLSVDLPDDDFRYSNELSTPEPQKQSIIPLVDALKLALPLVLQVKIESKELDFDDIDLVIKCLRMGGRHNVKDEVINKLTAAVSVKINHLTVTQMLSVVASLTNLRYPHTNINITLVDRVVKDCLDCVTTPGVLLPENTSLNFVISLITHSKDRKVYYHKGLFELVANLIVNNSNKVDITRTCQALWALTRHEHIHYGLMDFVAEQIAALNKQLLTNERISFINILTAFSLPSNYAPNKPNSEVIYETILKTPQIESCLERNKHLLFRVLKYLCILNYYPKQFIKECLTKHLDDGIALSTINGSRRDFLQTLVPIYQGLCLESNNFSDEENNQLRQKLKPFIEEFDALQSNELKDNLKSYSLHRSLSQGLGGPKFIANNIISDFGHCVDHMVAMRKGNYPIAIGEKEQITHIKDLELPNDCKIIGIIPLTNRDFCREPSILKGETDFKIRTLRKAGITPLMINLENWDSLLERERIPYLMREIQESSLIDTKLTNVS